MFNVEPRDEFVGQYFRVGNYESIYICSSVDLDDRFNVREIRFFNRYRHGTLEPQNISVDGNAMFSRVLNDELIAAEHRHNSEMA